MAHLKILKLGLSAIHLLELDPPLLDDLALTSIKVWKARGWSAWWPYNAALRLNCGKSIFAHR
jgi:hypothetical protein